jgi:hypothetical protein
MNSDALLLPGFATSSGVKINCENSPDMLMTCKNIHAVSGKQCGRNLESHIVILTADCRGCIQQTMRGNRYLSGTVRKVEHYLLLLLPIKLLQSFKCLFIEGPHHMVVLPHMASRL